MARVWTNWAREQRCAPERIERPGSEDELVRVVAGARRVKVAGSGHSFTDIACTDGAMVDLSGMNRVLDVSGEDVTVEIAPRAPRLTRTARNSSPSRMSSSSPPPVTSRTRTT